MDYVREDLKEKNIQKLPGLVKRLKNKQKGSLEESCESLIVGREERRFSVAVDASETCLGAVLFQVMDNVVHPVSYLSRKLRDSERKYSAVEKEALALVTSVRSFSPYLPLGPMTRLFATSGR